MHKREVMEFKDILYLPRVHIRYGLSGVCNRAGDRGQDHLAIDGLREKRHGTLIQGLRLHLSVTESGKDDDW